MTKVYCITNRTTEVPSSKRKQLTDSELYTLITYSEENDFSEYDTLAEAEEQFNELDTTISYQPSFNNPYYIIETYYLVEYELDSISNGVVENKELLQETRTATVMDLLAN